MLVLSRKRDEGIQIGEDIRVVVVEFRRDGRVRLGIEAPADVVVHRDEVAERIRQQKGPDKAA